MVDVPLVSQLQATLGLQMVSADNQILRSVKSRQSYRRYLERALGVERGLNVMLNNFTFNWDVASRSKLILLSTDLLALGASVEEILALPVCTAMRDVRDPVDAHCWLFVVERVSTAHWAAYHQLDSVTRELAASYLNAMLSRRGWEQISAAFDRFSVDDQVLEQLVASTDKAMREHYAWFAEEDDSSAIVRSRLARGSENVTSLLDSEAVPIVPPTKPTTATSAAPLPVANDSSDVVTK